MRAPLMPLPYLSRANEVRQVELKESSTQIMGLLATRLISIETANTVCCLSFNTPLQTDYAAAAASRPLYLCIVNNAFLIGFPLIKMVSHSCKNFGDFPGTCR